MSKELFQPFYSPAGTSYKDAKAAGTLLRSETYWIRLRHNEKTIREPTKTKDLAVAKEFLKRKKASLARGESHVEHAGNVTLQQMAENLQADYKLNNRDSETLGFRLKNLINVIGAATRLTQLRKTDIQ